MKTTAADEQYAYKRKSKKPRKSSLHHLNRTTENCKKHAEERKLKIITEVHAQQFLS